MQITISHGMQSVSVERPEGTTIGALLADANIRAILKHSENVVPVVEGAIVDSGYTLEEGDEVVLQAKAAVKA